MMARHGFIIEAACGDAFRTGLPLTSVMAKLEWVLPRSRGSSNMHSQCCGTTKSGQHCISEGVAILFLVICPSSSLDDIPSITFANGWPLRLAVEGLLLREGDNFEEP